VGADEADLELLNGAAREAGALAMSFFRNSPSAWSKEGGSPVTEADMAVDAFLRARLLGERPNYGWLSEETSDDPARLGCETIFAVDPIDGTRGFIEGDERWCVSLAVVRQGRPVAAALNVPAQGALYSAVEGGGAWIGEIRLAVSDRADIAGARLTGPRGWLKTATIQNLGADLQPHIPSLAYRFALVAASRIDAAFASPRAHDWDLAACDLLVHEAGGRLTGLDGAALRYNQEIPRHGALAAGNKGLQPIVLAAVAAAGQEIAQRRG
jgi:myo-inositol-1(or 4)-monophosphatase